MLGHFQIVTQLCSLPSTNQAPPPNLRVELKRCNFTSPGYNLQLPKQVVIGDWDERDQLLPCACIIPSNWLHFQACLASEQWDWLVIMIGSVRWDCHLVCAPYCLLYGTRFTMADNWASSIRLELRSKVWK